jgi:hypothetical protein
MLALCHTWRVPDLDDTESDDIGALLGADGPFARELPNFAPRLAQRRWRGQVIISTGTKALQDQLSRPAEGALRAARA